MHSILRIYKKLTPLQRLAWICNGILTILPHLVYHDVFRPIPIRVIVNASLMIACYTLAIATTTLLTVNTRTAPVGVLGCAIIVAYSLAFLIRWSPYPSTAS